MDPGEQPTVPKRLTQIEEMLIARGNPILQVNHTNGGQYKYSGHTISLPQDIKNIAKELPRRVSDLDVLIICQLNTQVQYYECYVSRSHVRDALEYKVKNDPNYKDVIINDDHLSELPEKRTNISDKLHTIKTNDEFINLHTTNQTDEEESKNEIPNMSSSVAKLPNRHHELEIIKQALELENSISESIIWPTIDTSQVNEYNTESLLDIAFPTLFPNGATLQSQPRLKEVKMHMYVLQLIRFYDQWFGRHRRFRYFIFNLMMCHCSQGLATIFIKKNVEENIPTTVENLHAHLKTLPNTQLAEELMCFGSSMRGTRPYWNKCHFELSSMINQIGSPTLFFTLTAADTKWPNL
ncbi:uncharacterized protein LOC131049446 [Cryptomeria japonica]|uniref:uncharacterized protein LOC131049446 n=1 Tax=Cryptomeria japonica TaxID=3369 RepID=UPI0027DA0C77|nr:uncharacterized protein LOC131049446 [Cryptomeria japonica]